MGAMSTLRELNIAHAPFSQMSGAYLQDGANSSVVPIVIDTGASSSLTPFFMDDFVSKLEPPDIQEMHGLSDSIQVEGVRWVEWHI